MHILNNINQYSYTLSGNYNQVEIQDCSIKHLKVSEGVKFLICDNVNLESIILPNSIESLYCNNNNLTTLHLPPNLINLSCTNNKIEKLIHLSTINKLKDLIVCNNKILKFDFKLPKLECLGISGNPNIKITDLDFVLNNENYEITYCRGDYFGIVGLGEGEFPNSGLMYELFNNMYPDKLYDIAGLTY